MTPRISPLPIITHTRVFRAWKFNWPRKNRQGWFVSSISISLTQQKKKNNKNWRSNLQIVLSERLSGGSDEFERRWTGGGDLDQGPVMSRGLDPFNWGEYSLKHPVTAPFSAMIAKPTYSLTSRFPLLIHFLLSFSYTYVIIYLYWRLGAFVLVDWIWNS